MRVVDHVWNSKTEGELKEQFGSHAFLSFDPAANGALVGWDSLHAKVYASTYRAAEDGVWKIARETAISEYPLLVVEAQFVGKSADAAIKASRRAGYFIGSYVMCLDHLQTEDTDVHVVWVKPTVWQAKVFPGKTGRGVKRGMLKELAMEHAHTEMLEHHVGCLKEQKRGLADAYCIGDAWRGIWQTS